MVGKVPLPAVPGIVQQWPKGSMAVLPPGMAVPKVSWSITQELCASFM